MLRGTRSTATLVASLVVATGALAACGSDTPGNGLDFGKGLDAVTISGDVGAAKLTFKERMEADKLESKTLVTGDGAALKDKDKVFVNYVLGDGYTRKNAVDTFGKDPAIQVTVGAAENAQPQSLDDVIKNVLADHIKAGVTRESRIVLTGSTEAMFGALAQSPALATEGIGNDDGLVLVADVLDVTPLTGPEGTATDAPGWAPEIVEKDDVPSGLDFGDLPKPTAKDPLSSAVLQEGTGKKVAEGDLLVLNYLGSVYDAKKPFDESYGKDKEPLVLPQGSFVPGFNEALLDKKVGSRVIMRIPPDKGYADSPPSEEIPKGATLYFVVDILAAV
ncbi:FKBP-type peptidyl-prolyl cis-trans isomerase [Nocardioides plantarum]|uniref:peptidylprolyl isomerase n=1 Tax=Nocardioides plantarum TaxID=29299 RepID=A0ABV5KDA0_9ACTN|nr:FKBP-type peptidyl-prolyl cis-trans isomerase [Nocardioides plantarum]